MHLSVLYEDHWKVLKHHPGGLGDSGKGKREKHAYSPLKYPEDRDRFLKWGRNAK